MNKIVKYISIIFLILLIIYLSLLSFLLIKFYDKNKSLKDNINKINLGFVMFIGMFLQYGLYGNRKLNESGGVYTINY